MIYPWYFDPLPMVYRTPYTWYVEPPTHDILNLLSMAYRTPIYGLSNPLPMVFWAPYPWYIDPPIHGILNPLPMVY